MATDIHLQSNGVTTRGGFATQLEELRQNGQPIILTIHGSAFAVEDEGSYHSLLELINRLETIGAVREGLRDIDEGRSLSLAEFKAEVQRKHGIPG